MYASCCAKLWRQTILPASSNRSLLSSVCFLVYWDTDHLWWTLSVSRENDKLLRLNCMRPKQVVRTNCFSLVCQRAWHKSMATRSLQSLYTLHFIDTIS